ncbi:MAG TPA: ATP-dependent Clp protease adaptor ClpS [Phaeodactylibacter sp.]|nr:ATP-dependent Clp protease adaptor ClpS [Phaeodactylibacter sp.]
MNLEKQLNAYDPSLEELEELLVVEKETIGEVAELIVYNDDVNTFDWVIQCFMEILKHTETQAEQCSMLIHLNGKATVKTAPKKELQIMKEGLTDRGLSAVIEYKN